MKLSFIIPVLNESENIRRILQPMTAFRHNGHEVIIVDGGSHDNTVELSQPLVDQVIESAKGRAKQMNNGASQATGDVLVFLHADTCLPEFATQMIETGLKKSNGLWGRFDVELSGSKSILRIIATVMNLRSRWTGIATGDQCIFVRREAFDKINGFPELSLMEDIALSKQLKKLSRPVCLRDKVITSSRRWEQQGVFQTILLMWYLRARYFFGSSTEKLEQIYYRNA